jgi:putative restriction endonuclease
MPEDVGTQEAEFLHKLRHLRKFSAGGRQAVHKPLLLLYALAELKHHQREMVRYREADEIVTPLLRKYGPSGTRARVSDPFARLEGDGIWEIKSTNREELFDNGGNARPGPLSKHNTEAGFNEEVLALLRRSPALIDEAAMVILDEALPAGDHSDLLAQIGLTIGTGEDTAVNIRD